jgi:hypothetical protein
VLARVLIGEHLKPVVCVQAADELSGDSGAFFRRLLKRSTELCRAALGGESISSLFFYLVHLHSEWERHIMAKKKNEDSQEEKIRKAFNIIDNLQEFIEDCRNCKVSYKKKEKPKKDGGTRIIYAPNERLKILQRELLRLFESWSSARCQCGFIKRCSCQDGVMDHIYGFDIDPWTQKPRSIRTPRWTLKIDLKEAFPSVRKKHLELLFRKMFAPLLKVDVFKVGNDKLELIYEEWIRLLLKFTAHKGIMPQGAPCSPYLLNLILVHSGIIRALEDKCKEREREYYSRRGRKFRSPFKMTVYADDITFSSVKDKIPNSFIRDVIQIIESHGIFKVNPDKIKRNSSKYKAHKITGLVLTGKYGEFEPRINLPKKTRNKYRGKIHLAIKILKGGRRPEKEKDGFSIYQVRGYVSRVRDIYRKSPIPPDLRKKVEEFEITWNKFKKEFGDNLY